MKINEIDLFQFLPQFMRDDRNSQAFVYAIQSHLNAVSSNIQYAKIYSRINSMNDALLDEMAWQFNIPEYNSSYETSIKRKLVKEALITHHNRGTAGAVERVAINIFGNATLSEWFEYGGLPYRFKIYTSNPSSSDEMIAELERVTKETQNIRSHLEEVIVELMQNMNLYIGFKTIIMDDITMKTMGVD